MARTTGPLRHMLPLASLMFCVWMCGCGGGEKIPTGTVSGTVTFQGTPVTAGFVNLFSRESGRAYVVPLEAEGKFSFAEPVPIGPYGVFVTPPEGPPPTVENPTPAQPNPENIPAKYRTEQTTSLNAEIQEGLNELTLDMQP